MSDTTQDTCSSYPDWMSFRVIFRTFGLAVHSGKMLLGIAGLMVTYLFGAGLDAIWSAGGATVYSGEIAEYVSRPVFSTWKERRRQADDQMLAGLMVEYKIATTPDAAREMLAKDRAEQRGALARIVGEHFANLIEIEKRRTDEESRIAKLPEDQRTAERNKLDEHLPEWVAESRAEYLALREEIRNLGNQGIFREWITHELHFARTALVGLLHGKIVSDPYAEEGRRGSPFNPFAPTSFLGALVCAAGATCWLLHEHTVYAIIFLLGFLAIWSLFGGAICRMAALHATLDRRISIRHALSFSASKWKDFLLAPIIPILFIGIVGLLLILGGLVTSIPLVGDIVGPLMFPLALLGGFIISLVVVGMAGGLGLMWPTIGVEGSDSFDAISRSFSYIYNRPWRAIIAGLLFFVYGGLCYLFLRFFLWLMLTSVHLFVAAGAGIAADRPEAGAEMNKFDVMWRTPSFTDLRPHFDSVHLSLAEPFGAVVIWVCVTVLLLGLQAFVVSFGFCGLTWIYLLLRREVDATDLEDVYDDEAETDESDAASTSGTAESTGRSLPVMNAGPVPQAPGTDEPNTGAGGDSSTGH